MARSIPGPAERGREKSTLPVAREELAVGKRKVVTGTVRVRTRVRENPYHVDQVLHAEEARVERTPMDRVVAGPIEPRYEGDTLVISVVEEQLHVETRYVLKEEVRVAHRRWKRAHHDTVTLRTEEAIVDREAGEAPEDDPASTPRRGRR